MILRQALLDTDSLSYYMSRDQRIVTQVENYLQEYGQINFSIMTRYEILRGLKARGAGTRLKRFDALCALNNVIALTDEIVNRAADVYADLYKRGKPISEGDVLIAATALVNGLVVVTNNEKHFSRVAGLDIQN